MPIPQLRKRSYGYVGQPQQKPKKRLFSFKKLPGRRPNLGKYKKKVVKFLLYTGIGFFVFGFLGFTIMAAWVGRDLPDPDKLLDRNVHQSTKIYDHTGEHLLYEIFADERRTVVELEDIPQDLINGVIATEDTKFYEHKGIRPLSILRAFVYGIFTSRRISGTSTLTQQLVKNAILTTERSYIRKLKEVILSIRLEQKYTKEQILKIYFNEIPYGSTNYGAESAAQSYFGKHVSDLTLAESATLAGLPQSPSRYLNNIEALQNRRNFVLRRMQEEGFITEEQKTSAQAETLEIKQQFHNIEAPHFVLHVKEQLVEKYGEALVETGGLKVITSLDWDKQQIIEKIIQEQGDTILGDADADNVALVAMDPKTGQILAMLGSRDFYNEEIDGQFNVATLGKRQPGSSFKPIIYAAAFEKGYTPDTVLYDVVTNFAVSGKPYTPLNYDENERGPITVRYALQGSLNIPAVQTMYLVGEKKAEEFAERLGYSTLKEGNFGLSLVLGGGEVKLLEHTSAYTAFANNGILHSPVSILRVEDNSGKVIEEWKQEKGKEAMDPKIAATISNILSDDAARSYIFGAGGILTLPDRPVAAKTGTTNNYVDAWTMGYTPSLVVGVWAGNTDNTPMKRGYGGGMVAARIWNAFMKESLKNTPVEQFPSLPTNDAEKPVLRGSEGGKITLSIDKVTGKRATSSTPEQYTEERTYIQAHSILHYVNKDEPRGPVPEHPEEDPQYTLWENAIQNWITRMKEKNPDWNVSFEDPPTEFDDAHSLELIPTLEVSYPQPNEVITSRTITSDIKTSAPRGITKVTYKLDTKYIAVVREHPFNLSYDAQTEAPGEHVLTIIVEDDVGNKLEQQVPIVLQVNEQPPSVFFESVPEKISRSSFPQMFLLNHHRLNEIESVSIYAQKQGGSKNLISTIDDFSQLSDNRIKFMWNSAPDSGVYELSTNVTIIGGTQNQSDHIMLTIE